jgi:hypothetical protein
MIALKNISAALLIFLIPVLSFAQLHPANDTLIPKQHRDDTVQYEPKLTGGALIDTINTKEKKFYRHPAHVSDTSKTRKDSIINQGKRK